MRTQCQGHIEHPEPGIPERVPQAESASPSGGTRDDVRQLIYPIGATWNASGGPRLGSRLPRHVQTTPPQKPHLIGLR